MNRRKSTNFLSNADFKAILATDAKATAIGLPFNVLISFYPRNAMGLEDWLAECKRIRNCYCQFGRQNGFQRAWLYVREVALETMAEHMHLLFHVPKKHRATLIANAKGWRREPDACHACVASTKGYWSRRGYWFSTLLYVCKQMSPQAVFGRPYRRIGGAPIDGARWGASRNIKGG